MKTTNLIVASSSNKINISIAYLNPLSTLRIIIIFALSLGAIRTYSVNIKRGTKFIIVLRNVFKKIAHTGRFFFSKNSIL